VFDADFTAPTYNDGAANVQPGFGGAGLTQASYSISDSAGTGVLSNTGSFTRAQFGPGNGGQTVAVGDMIIVEAFDFVVTGTINSRTLLGLSDGGLGGGANGAIGSQLSVDGSGNIFVENDAFAVDGANRVDTGFDVGDAAFDWGFKLTAETAGNIEAVSYTIDHLINGVSILQETGQGITGGANANPAAAHYLAGFIQDQGAGATVTTSQLTVSTVGAAVVIPEPSSLGLLFLASFAGLTRRRR